MSTIKVNTITTRTGCTMTLGESGKTIALATGASQTGFGRTGTVDWQTGSIKTSTFTAVNGQGFFVNTAGGAVTVNLPAGSAGAIVSIADYNSSFGTNNCTVSPNGSEKIGGNTIDVVLNTDGQSITLVYVDSTEGWVTVNDSSENVVGNQFLVATGGTITNTPTCRIHTFTSPGTFTVTAVAVCAANNVLSHLVVAGGGGGGTTPGTDNGAGGGAGGYREVKSPVTPYTASPLDGYPSAPNRITASAQGYPIIIGAGGAGGSSGNEHGEDGSVSTFSTISSAGGGGGGGIESGSPFPNGGRGGASGGSGGGSAGGTIGLAGGVGNTPPTSPAQGTNGGLSSTGPSPDKGAGGGGGATQTGLQGGAPTCSSGNGGAGATSSINGTPTARAGGGGGSPPSSGGSGGGANGGAAGTTNTGGGGGGQRCGNSAGNGGSGIVIIRYKVA